MGIIGVEGDFYAKNTYGWPHNLSDEEILERPLALNLEWAAKT